MSNIKSSLEGIRAHEDEMVNLVAEAEPEVPRIKRERPDFYKAYTIVLLEEFCDNPDERELMLASFYLLKGFSRCSKDTRKCAIKYWEHSRNYNCLLKNIKTPDSAYKTLRKLWKGIIERISKKIDEKLMSDRKLGLSNRVPDKWELPSPRESENDELKRISIMNPENDSFLKLIGANRLIDEILKSILDHRYDLLELPFDVLSRFNKSISTSEGLRKVVENAGKDVVCLFLLILALYYLNKPLLDKTDSPRVTYTDSYDSLGNMNYGGSIKEPIISVSLRDKIHIGK